MKHTRIKFLTSMFLSVTLAVQVFTVSVFADNTQIGADGNPIIQGETTTPSVIQLTPNALSIASTTPSIIDITIENSTGNLNLTEQGTIDWAHFATVDSYKNVPQHTITYTKLGETVLAQMSDSPVSFTWSDGVPEASQTEVKTGKVHKQQAGGLTANTENGWQFAIGADSRKRNLIFTCGGWQSQFTLSVYVDGNMTPAYQEEFATTTTAINKKMNFYLAPEHSYEVKAVMKKVTHSNGNVTLSSVFVNEALADKTPLKSFINSVKSLEKENYTIATWEVMEQTISASESVLASIISTQDEVDAAYNALMQSVIALQPAEGVDMNAKLAGIIADLVSVSIAGYEQKTIDKFQQGILSAQQALITANANKEWDLAYANILTALHNLKPDTKYTDQTNPGLTSNFGVEGDKNAPIAYIDGSYLLRDRASVMIRFGVTGIPSKIKWENHSGYLPCFVSEFSKDEISYKIENFADKVTINDNNYVICYSRVTTQNTGSVPKLLPIVSSELIPLNEPTKGKVIIGANETLVRDYAIAGDRFGKTDIEWPAKEEILAAGTFDEHFVSMKTYWDERLSKVAEIKQLPDEKLINAYKAGFIYTLICKDGNSLNVGENGYDKLYDHDSMGIIASLLTIGDFQDMKNYLDILPADAQFEDSKWKFSWPFALYLSKTGDKAYIRQNFEKIKTNTHKITLDRVDNGKGIIKVTYSVDNWGQWTIDNWSALFGLMTYKYLCNEIGETQEAQWAQAEYDDLLAVVNATLEKTLKKYNIDYIPASIVEPNETNVRCIDPRDANWASMFLFGRWAWDGYLFNARQEGVNLDLIDNTYAHGFDRAKALLPAYNFGGYPHGIYSSAYNAGYGSTGLRGEEYREVGIKAYQFMIENAMSGPFGWWEGVDYPDAASPWNINHAKGGGGSCQHMWGQSVATKVLVDSIIAEKVDGTVIVGRGLLNDWIAGGQNVEIANYPLINNKRMGYKLSVSGKELTINFSGDMPSGPISVELPILKNNIAFSSAGTVDNAKGKVILNESERTVKIFIKQIVPEKLALAAPNIQSVNKENDNIKVKWNAVSQAEGYTVECLLNETVVEKVTVKDITQASIATQKLYPDFTYEFRVKAYAGSVSSEKSNSMSYKLEMPDLTQGNQLLGEMQAPQSIVNLTDEGKTDWMRLGKRVGLTIERKNIANGVIGIYLIGNKKVTQMTDSSVKFNWTDGTSEITGTDTRYGSVFNPLAGDINAKGDLWMISVPASTNERILRIYTSTWAANTTFKAYLNSNSATPITYTVESPSSSSYKVFEFKYKSNSNTDKLIIKSSIDKKFNNNGNTTLLAVSLNEIVKTTTGGSSSSGSSSSTTVKEENKKEIPVVTETKSQNNTQIQLNTAAFKEIKNLTSTSFKDTTNNFAQNSIQTIAKYGIMIGNKEGNFEPNRTISRGEVAALLRRMVSIETNTTTSFKDITSNKYYDQAVLDLAALKIISGYEDGTFKPQKAITRQEFAAIIGKLLTNLPVKENLPAPNTLSFKDSKDVKDWAKNDVAVLTQIGIIKGDTANAFNPDKEITRAEVSVIVERLLQYLQIV